MGPNLKGHHVDVFVVLADEQLGLGPGLVPGFAGVDGRSAERVVEHLQTQGSQPSDVGHFLGGHFLDGPSGWSCCRESCKKVAHLDRYRSKLPLATNVSYIIVTFYNYNH